ncbi:unnamed protein product [Coregonus sp. 'balchen']|nr:unnamed protein product [Coregonus sp. 'balchen']
MRAIRPMQKRYVRRVHRFSMVRRSPCECFRYTSRMGRLNSLGLPTTPSALWFCWDSLSRARLTEPNSRFSVWMSSSSTWCSTTRIREPATPKIGLTTAAAEEMVATHCSTFTRPCFSLARSSTISISDMMARRGSRHRSQNQNHNYQDYYYRTIRRETATDLTQCAAAAMDKETVLIILNGIEKVSSFASTINPLFNIVTAVVKVTKGLVAKDLTQDLDAQQFRRIHAKLESISKTNQQILKQIHLDEVNEKYSKYEEYIKHQYTALNTMVEQIEKDPEGREGYMAEFQRVYERDKSTLALNTYYSGVIKEKKNFEQRGLLEVYLEHYKEERGDMEKKCSQLANVFRMGLMTLMAYTVVTEDNEDEVRDKWAPRVKAIQAKMDEALAQWNYAPFSLSEATILPNPFKHYLVLTSVS